jgi:hypothetical protein
LGINTISPKVWRPWLPLATWATAGNWPTQSQSDIMSAAARHGFLMGVPLAAEQNRRIQSNSPNTWRNEMARKVVNRMALREESEAAEKAEKAAGKKAAKPAARRSRKKEPVEVRVKLFWGVFNQSLKRVALYEYSQRKQADKKAQELGQGGKSPHFVQKVKEVIQE